MREFARVDSKNLRLRARRDVASGLVGPYRSAFRGRGLTFEELRDYTPGDDVRWMEWNATARLARPIVKRMREERDLVVALLVDVSRSLSFGSSGTTKRDAILRTAAALAYTAFSAQDRVALVTFDSERIACIDPGRGAVHLERIFQALSGSPRGGAPTRPASAFRWALRALPRHSLVLLLTDLLFPDPGPPLRRCARKHELVVLRVADPADTLPRGLPPVRVLAMEEEVPLVLRPTRGPSPAESPSALTPSDLARLGVDVGTVWTGGRLLASLRQFLESRPGRAA